MTMIVGIAVGFEIKFLQQQKNTNSAAQWIDISIKCPNSVRSGLYLVFNLFEIVKAYLALDSKSIPISNPHHWRPLAN